MKILSEFTVDISTLKKIKLAIPETKLEFNEYFYLRYKVLREPWKQPEGSEKDEGDETSYHVCLLHRHMMVGVCRMQINSADEAQIRYMAVHELYRGENLGVVMLSYFERMAREKGIDTMILQARETAVKFYARNGYEVVEKTFLLFNEIQHYLMKKNLVKVV